MPGKPLDKSPNIVYILADDMGYGDVSCLNENSRIHTVNIDRMAAGGMRFTDAHATSAVCTPSRYGIITGRYNWRSWLKRGVTDGYSPPVIEPDRLTVAGLLRERGYATACIGKWHLGWHWARDAAGEPDFSGRIERGPLSAGFDYFFGISASLDMPPYVYVENDRPTAVPDRMVPKSSGKAFWREGPLAPDFRHDQVLPQLAARSLAYIDEQSRSGRPFFLYLALPAPHTPILPSPEFQGKSGTNAYGDFCLQCDDVVGQVMAALDRHGIADDTILVFTSDNGCSPTADFEELARCKHFPSYVFRGHKADIYEGGHRIPLIIRWPRFIRSASASAETVCLVDLMATCAEITGGGLPDDAGEDSVSNLPVWRGGRLDAALREATVHHSFDGSFAIRAGRWKLEMCPGSGGWSRPRPGEECAGLPALQLYDLREDPGEQNNVYREHPGVIEDLKALLTRYVRQGRSTPGAPRANHGGCSWEQLWWMLSE